MAENYGVKGKRIAFLGNVSHKKGIELLIHSFEAVHSFDPEFTLHIAGKIQDPRYAVYFDHIIPELGLVDSIHYYDEIEHVLVKEWLESKDFILITSPLEGCPVGALEALSCGLTPLFYSFVGAKELYPPDFVWKTFDGLLDLVEAGPKDPEICKKFVRENYSQEKQFQKLDEIVENLLETVEKTQEIGENSTVTCVIAVKNGEKTVARALQSLHAQTYPLTEIILVDDASTDDTVKVVMANIGSETEMVFCEKSTWVFSARNLGFERVETDYFFFLDADDWVDPTYVEKMVQILDKNRMIDVVYPDMIYFTKGGDEQVFKQPEFQAQNLAQHNFVAYCSMQRTVVFKQLGGFSEYLNDTRNHLTEWELWLRYAKLGKGFVRLPEPLFHYFHDATVEQMSADYERSKDDMSLELALKLADNPTEIQMTGIGKRIVLVVQGKDYCDRSKVGFELMQVYKPLEEFGQVFVFQYDIETKYYGRSEMQERLKTFIDLVSPDYVFHFSYKSDILPRTWIEITEKYCTIVHNSDDDRRYDEFTKDYGKAFRHSITTYPLIYERMEHPGRILSQWGANPFYFRPSSKKTIDVSFIGQKYGDREEMLSKLNVKTHGAGWPNGFVDFAEMARIIAQSRISINFAKGADGNKQIKLRPFEICACNTLCLCEYVEGIEEYFEIGTEILTFRTKEELNGMVMHYLAQPDAAKKIAKAGYDRTVKDHLWSNRLSKVFEEVGV
jgi:glycosyltransferase involved in cell wall biosynthesis